MSRRCCSIPARPGSGNSAIYNLTLPKDPPKLPKQNGTGGTFSFQLHPAFWFGMAMCDTQSFPEFTNTCVPTPTPTFLTALTPTPPTSSASIPAPRSWRCSFIRRDWATSCDGKHWCAALNIDSFNFDPNKNVRQQSPMRRVQCRPRNRQFRLHHQERKAPITQPTRCNPSAIAHDSSQPIC